MKKTVVVTGADRGLGYEIARQCAKRGDVVFAGKYRTKWPLLAELAQTYPENVHIIPLDVRYDKSVASAAAYILEHTDKIDILFNVAGVWLSHGSGSILDNKYDYDKMAEEFNVNALGMLRVTQALIVAVLKGFDKLIINISSEAGSITNCKKNDQPGYCMSKAALNMASVVVLNNIRNMGGAVLNIHPGWMQSVIGNPADPDAPYVPLPTLEQVKFQTTPERSAEGILHIAEEYDRFSGREPGFVNYLGDPMKY
ncbi:MAG: SDR family NAD(P)-dependent oxidoreductase [Oscillospiraceae bacterium]|jgi:NAD(P)-dependent dehydrogenase (short-subunit alcohol dehydrogenase family)|nr:SDR family NAD(P)-dependent oxidoreductase [Oscillospiraceae bacterium]